MSSDIVISVRNVSKCYNIYERPIDRLRQIFLRRRQLYREFWAVKDVSFEVKRGETVGIIGRNGSGKSTLLQLICGTLRPSGGTIATHGRIAALLELGAGFNPEYSGRENVYLNGALFGITRDAMQERFAAIERFADIGTFIEQPVKLYSSGMLVRLAFAVAVHCEPDILVVDEALSVGDIAFRNKCMEHIHSLVRKGVTILFVTHDLGTLQLLCNKAMWLDKGECRMIGDPVQVTQRYFADATATGGTHLAAPVTQQVPQQATGLGKFTKVRLASSRPDEPIVSGQPFRADFEVEFARDVNAVVIALSVYRSDNDWLIGQTSLDDGIVWPGVHAGERLVGAVVFDAMLLAPGDYWLALAAYSADYSVCYALTDLVCKFSVTSPLPAWGKFRHPATWLRLS